MRGIAGVLLLAACGGGQAKPVMAQTESEAVEEVADPQSYEELSVFFARKRTHVGQCYNNAFVAVEPKLRRSGFVTVEMNVSPAGKAQNLRIAGSSLGSKEVEDCVVAMVSRWILPQPPRTMAFSYSYDFKPE
jgi:TonB family protein